MAITACGPAPGGETPVVGSLIVALPDGGDSTIAGCFEATLTTNPAGILRVTVLASDPVESLQPRRQRLDWVGPGRFQVMEEMVRPPVRGVRISAYNGPPPTTGVEGVLLFPADSAVTIQGRYWNHSGGERALSGHGRRVDCAP